LLRGRLQLEGFEILGAKARVRDVVKRRLELAESPVQGQPANPAALHRQAVVLQRLVGLYGLYEHIRRAEPPGPRRTAALDQLASRMQAAGREAEFDSAEVIVWFHQGTDALRVIALNLMLANQNAHGGSDASDATLHSPSSASACSIDSARTPSPLRWRSTTTRAA
jgi:hypothetical protein